MLRIVVAFVLMAAAAQAQPAPPWLEVWSGSWLLAGPPSDLERVRIDARGVVVTWRSEERSCDLASATRPNAPLLSAVFRCPAGQLALWVALTGDRRELVAHVWGDTLEPRVYTLFRPTAKITPPPTAALPQFPWPPPRWSLRDVLRPGLAVSAANEPLGDIYDRLKTALGRGGLQETSTFAIGTDGFALIGRMEQIDDQGVPSSTRWAQRPPAGPIRSFTDYLRSLFKAQPGRYRLIVFAVTGLTVTASPTPPTAAQMKELLVSGGGDLSLELRKKPLPDGGRCEALIYEFFQQSADDQPAIVDPSQLTVPVHLAGAGLWTLKELLP